MTTGMWIGVGVGLVWAWLTWGRHGFFVSLAVLWVGFVLVLAVPAQARPPSWAPARGMTTLVQDGTYRPQPYQRWIDSAKVPTPALTVELHTAGCPDNPTAAGCMTISPDEAPDPVIYLTPSGALLPVYGVRQVLLHELGHVYDALHPELRAGYLAIFGAAGSEWDDPWRESFADTYSMCALDWGFARGVWHSHRPTLREWRRSCRLIRG